MTLPFTITSRSDRKSSKTFSPQPEPSPYPLTRKGGAILLYSPGGYARRKEELRKRITSFYEKEAGWDFYGTERTSPECLDMALKFLEFFTHPMQRPQFGAGTGENVSFFWRNPAQYLIINMLARNRISFYYREPPTKYYGEMNFPESGLPIPLKALILDIRPDA